MYELDRQQFGAFVARLRKEKGYTQKDLAQQLHLSDKAVSKWETGVSIPDTALLVPLAEILGVTVTELLLCRRQERDEKLDSGTVEAVVKTAIQYPQEKPERAYRRKSRWFFWYPICLLIGIAGLWGNWMLEMSMAVVPTPVCLGAVFGAYFCFFARIKLPELYDKYSLSLVYDGFFRMHLPGVRFHNGNWSDIVTVGRVWSCAVMVVMPLLNLALGMLIPEGSEFVMLLVVMALAMGGLFVPMYVVAKK